MKLLDVLSSRISAVAAVIATLCTLALALTITTDVFARLFSGRSLPGLVEASETLLVMLIFLGMAFASYSGAQITMDLVTSALPRKVAAWVRFVTHILVVGFLTWILSATAARAVNSFLTAEYKFGLVHWPLWPARGSIALGLLLCIPVYFLLAWRDLAEARGKLSASEAPAQPTALI